MSLLRFANGHKVQMEQANKNEHIMIEGRQRQGYELVFRRKQEDELDEIIAFFRDAENLERMKIYHHSNDESLTDDQLDEVVIDGEVRPGEACVELEAYTKRGPYTPERVLAKPADHIFPAVYEWEMRVTIGQRHFDEAV